MTPKESLDYIKFKTSSLWGPPLSRFRDKNIVMFHMGRCGSTVLGDLLGQHSKIVWTGEIYYPHIRQWRLQKQKFRDSQLKPDPLTTLQRKMFTAGMLNYGCEIKFHHLYEARVSLPDFIDLLIQKNFSFLILRRKNFLRSIVSNAVMYSLSEKKTHIRSDEKATLRKVSIDPNKTIYDGYEKPLLEHLETYFKNYKELEKILTDLDQDFLSLSFEEEITEDPSVAYRKICEFLGIEYEDQSVRLSKTNPFPLSDIIENFDEIKEYLADTQYAWMCSS